MSTHRHNWTPRGPYDSGDIRHCTLCGRRQKRAAFTPGGNSPVRWEEMPPVPASERRRLSEYDRLRKRIAMSVHVSPEAASPALRRDRARFATLLDEIPAGM